MYIVNKTALAVFTFFVYLGGTNATEFQVPGDFGTIQAAIDAAIDGDTVTVASGLYVENVDFLGKGIVVASIDGAMSTTIDGGAAGPVVRFVGGETRDAVLRGFTIRNGLSEEGGGIMISTSSPTIESNYIVGNRACEGAGIGMVMSSAVIRSNNILGNVQDGCAGGFGGGGILIRGPGSANIIENMISQNHIDSSGGAISMFEAGAPYVGNNIMARNTAGGTGGALAIINSDAVLVQNLIYFNFAYSQAGGISWRVGSGTRGPMLINNTIARNIGWHGASAIYADGSDENVLIVNNVLEGHPGWATVICGFLDGSSRPIFLNNNVYRLEGEAYGGLCVDMTGFAGNISTDPMFVDPGMANFRLLAGSSSIDSGKNLAVLPAVDLYGAPRVLDGDGDGTATVDMGAIELNPSQAMH